MQKPLIQSLAKGIFGLASLFLLLTCQPREPFFRQLSPEATGIRFVNEVHDTDSLNILNHIYFYNGGGVAIGDINNDGLQDIFFTANHKGRNKLYLNKGNLTFEDITAKAGVAGQSDWNTGVTMADANADGWLDIYVCGVNVPNRLRSRNELYINNRNGTFSEQASRYGLDFQGHSTQAAFFDFDKDDDLDCFLLNHSLNLNDYYQDTSARRKVDLVSGNQILINSPPAPEGGVYFSPPSGAGGLGIYRSNLGYGLGVSIGDLNNDGWDDIYVANDFRENDYCYLNNGDGTFSEEGNRLFGHHSRFSMGCDMADYNNDGRLDVITLDMLPSDETVLKSSLGDDFSDVYDFKRSFGYYYQFSRNCLHEAPPLPKGESLFPSPNGRRAGDGGFSDVALMKGIAATDWSWTPLFADFNNDGVKDLIVANGIQRRTNDLDFTRFINDEANLQLLRQRKKLAEIASHMPEGKVPDYFFEGTAGYSFTDRSADYGFSQPTLSNGAAYADLDNDGDLDVVFNRVNEPAGVYENRTPRQNYLQIELKGSPKNRFGLGTKVYAYAAGQMQLYYQMPTRGFQSAVSPVLHVGLGKAAVVDSLVIIWPRNRKQVLRQVAVNQKLVLKYENASPFTEKPGFDVSEAERSEAPPMAANTIFTNLTDSLQLDWTHREDDFNDFRVNPFIPHKVSTQGPKIAVGDVNGDGLEDFYVCGAKLQAGALFVQKASSLGGGWGRLHIPAFQRDSLCEDTDALFFDADGDKDLDLYVASGGNEFYGMNEALKDRLYLNDGKGNFTRSTTLPDLYENKSCVRAADFDKDGDLDLFVGGRVNARMYGMKPASALLQNDGKGNFRVVTETLAPELTFVGMVTDAAWSDVDKDGWPDLMLVGEWMPVTVFRNQDGKKLIRNPPSEIRNSEGLCNCLLPTDFDHDGDEDFLLGNWGTNTKVQTIEANPLRLYLTDVDENGEQDPLLAVYKSGNYYPFLPKEELEKRLPSLRKQFPKYSEMAGKTMRKIFGKSLEKARVFEAKTLKSALLKNDNGEFKLIPLPDDLQRAPVFCFAEHKSGKDSFYIAAGNFYGTSPYEGRADALPLTVFTLQPDGQAKIQAQKLVFSEFRDLKSVRLADGRTLWLAARNDDRCFVFTLQPKPASSLAVRLPKK